MIEHLQTIPSLDLKNWFSCQKHLKFGIEIAVIAEVNLKI